MGRAAQKKQADQRQTRERILNGASLLFAEQGYAAASISKIAKKAGVLPGSIYWAFSSKEEIFAEVLKRAGESWKEQFVPVIEAGRDIDPKTYGDYFTELADAFREAPEFLRLIMVVATERQAGNPEILKAARDVRDFWRERMEQAILEYLRDCDPQQAALFARRMSRLTIQLLDGVFLSRQIEQDEVAIEELFRDVGQVISRELTYGAEQLRGRTPAPKD